MSEQYDDFDRALLRAGKKAAAPTSRMRSRALSAAAAAGATGAATAATTKAAAATKIGAVAKATKAILLAKWTMLAAVTTASIGTAVYVVETRVEKNETIPVAAAVAPPVLKPVATPVASVAPPVAPAEEKVEAVEEPKPVVTAVKAAPVVSAAKTVTVDPLREELGLVEDARRALAAGDASTALRQVDEHARRFPSGAFAVERDVIRIDALAAAGRRDEAASRARDFLAHHPGSAQARRIAKITETNP